MPKYRIEWIEHKWLDVWAEDEMGALRVPRLDNVCTEYSFKKVAEVNGYDDPALLDAIEETKDGWVVRASKPYEGEI